MQFGFDTESIEHGKAALLLYAMYRSRDEKSSLNGVDTWNRFDDYIQGACRESETIGEFIQIFSDTAEIGSIKPKYLKTDGLVKIDNFGTLAQIDDIYNYQLDILQDNNLLKLIRRESKLILHIIRERIQRDKELFQNDIEN